MADQGVSLYPAHVEGLLSGLPQLHNKVKVMNDYIPSFPVHQRVQGLLSGLLQLHYNQVKVMNEAIPAFPVHQRGVNFKYVAICSIIF